MYSIMCKSSREGKKRNKLIVIDDEDDKPIIIDLDTKVGIELQT